MDNFRGRFPGHRMPVLPGLELWVRDYTCMGKREVDEFLLFNMRNLHSGQLYADDFYFQVSAPPLCAAPPHCSSALPSHRVPRSHFRCSCAELCQHAPMSVPLRRHAWGHVALAVLV